MIAALYLLICLIWGSTWLVIKVGLIGVPPFLAAGVRFVLSAGIVGAVLAARRRPIRLTHDDRVCIVSLGLLVFWLDYACVYWAEMYISSGLTAVLFSTMPLMTALLSTFWTRTETLSVRKILGILVGIVGTIVLFWPSEQPGLMASLGMLSTLTGSLCASINLVTLKKHGARSDPWILNFFGMGLGAVCLLLMSVLVESRGEVKWTRDNVLAIVYLAVFGSVVAFSAYYYLLKRLDATLVSLSTLIIPIVALALGRAFLGETVRGTAILGIVMVLGGVGAAIVPATKIRQAVRAAAS